MRKTMFWSSVSVIVAALLGSSCKREPSEQAGDQARKSVEEVREQQKDVTEEKKDVTEEKKDVTEEQREQMKQQRELSQAQGQAAQAHANYIAAMRQRLATIDARIRELEARTDAESKDAAAKLRVRRDAFAAKLDEAGTRSEAQWGAYTTDLDNAAKQLDEEIDAALR